VFHLVEKSLSYKNIYIVLSLKITKSTVFGKFFRRDTAVSCSMCKKLCPFACNARMKHMVNKINWERRGEERKEGGREGGRNRHGSTGGLGTDLAQEDKEIYTVRERKERCIQVIML